MVNSHLKILFITFEYDEEIAGGVGRVLNGIVPVIREKIELHVMLIHHKYFIYRMRKSKWVKERHPRFQLKILIKMINLEKYDAVHIFHVNQITAEATKIIKDKFPQLKIIYSCHSIAKYEYIIRKTYPDWLKYEDYIINYIDHIHLLNQSSLKYITDTYDLKAHQITYSIIPNGIDEDSFQRQDCRFAGKMNQLLKQPDMITVLCMSRWSWGKGLEYFLDAVPKVVDRFHNIRFIMAGRKSNSWENGYQDYRRGIDKKIALLAEHVIPLGWLDDRQRNTLFTFADIWVMPSLLEYFPYSILEPMIAKIPIISADIDCVREMLNDEEECLLYEPKSPDQLADQIIRFIQNPAFRAKMAENAYHKATELYQWSLISEMYLKMYQTVLHRPELNPDQVSESSR